jgi:hypothetical protein
MKFASRIRRFKKTAVVALLVIPALVLLLLQPSFDDKKIEKFPSQVRLENVRQTTAPKVAVIENRKSKLGTQLGQQGKREKTKILLFIAIHTAPIRIDRRNALRETWLTKCQGNPKVAYWFFTDNQDTHGNVIEGEIRAKLENERKVFGDLILADTPGGLNFGLWYLWMIEWATERYDFQYIVKLDDDYFVCFDKLINELEFHRPKKRLTWGWLHCRKEGKFLYK